MISKEFGSRIALVCTLVSALCAPASSAIAAGNAYDGSWNLSFLTRSGDCDPSYNFTVNVSRGIITHPNLLKFRGRITRTGATRASVRVGEKFASGTGRVSGSAGGGVWNGYSGQARCSGQWTAQKN